MKVNRKVQNLFKSQEIIPEKLLTKLEKVYGTASLVLNSEGYGLYKMFEHAMYTPLEVTWDFSKGKEKDICLLGKGVLYDSGGYNIKDDSSKMFNDKFGALTAIEIAARLSLPVKVFLVVNLIHDEATLPGTILKSGNGKKVQIIDTDAEGRIGLAQLIERSSKYKKLLTFATLTGHSVNAVGSGHAEVFSKDMLFLSKLLISNLDVLAVGRYFNDYDEGLMEGKIIQNYNKSYREAGAGKAYAFLTKFLSPTQELYHFDIAGIMNDQYENFGFGFKELSYAVENIMETALTNK